MASVLRQLWGLPRFSERFLAVRHSSNLSTISQGSPSLRCFEYKPEVYSSYGSCISAGRVKMMFAPNFVSPSIERQAPPIMPYGQIKSFDLPTAAAQVSLEMPTTKSLLDKVQITPDIVKIEAPQQGQIVEKRAHRMIVLRRRKMKKHKLKKFRKKFRVLLLTRKQKRNSAKETAFLTEILNTLSKGEAFDPKEYVHMKLKKAYSPLPTKPELTRPLPWEFQPIFHMSKNKKN